MVECFNFASGFFGSGGRGGFSSFFYMYVGVRGFNR